jgi:hypothetical protein
VRIPIQNPSVTHAFADHELSEVGRKLTIIWCPGAAAEGQETAERQIEEIQSLHYK